VEPDWTSPKKIDKIYPAVHGLDNGFRKCFESRWIIRWRAYVTYSLSGDPHYHSNHLVSVILLVGTNVNVKVRKRVIGPGPQQ